MEEKDFISEEDKELISNLYSLSSDIFRLYYAISELNDKTINLSNSDSYLKEKRPLETLLTVEKKAYLECEKYDKMQILSIINCIRTINNVSKMPTIETLLRGNYENIISRRIINRLANMILEKGSPDDFHIPAELFDDEDNLKEKLVQTISINKSIEEDALNILLVNTNMKANTIFDSNLRSSLNRFKFCLSYVYGNLEKEMIDNNWNVNDSIYLSSKFVSDFFGIGEDTYEEIKNIIGNDIVKAQFNNLFQFKDEKSDFELVTRECFLRTGFYLMKEEDIYEFHELFHNYLDHPEETDLDITSKLKTNIISSSFKNITNDKNRHKVVSLKLVK